MASGPKARPKRKKGLQRSSRDITQRIRKWYVASRKVRIDAQRVLNLKYV
jgi:hypothetical protein